MNEPIHSRGTGRSGPKRKTGCLTCRRRKVRCDEARPVCANCIRLRLDCEYVPARSKSARSPSTVHRSLSSTSQMSFGDSQQSSTMSSSAQVLPSTPTTSYEVHGSHWNVTHNTVPSFAPHFPDSFLTSLNNFDVGIEFPDNNEAFLGPQEFYNATEVMRTQVGSSNMNEVSNNSTSINSTAGRQKLLEHFVQSVNPTRLMQPTDTQWISACRSLIEMADECAFLLSAIYSLSALHMYCTAVADNFDEAFRQYRFAAREATNVLDCASSNDRQLKQAFAATFLLTYSELVAQTTAKGKQSGWPLRHVQNFHHRIRQHNERVRSWTGVSKRMLIWTIILQTKAEWNSGDPALEQSSISLSAYSGDPFVQYGHPFIASGSPSIKRSSVSSQDVDEIPMAIEEEEEARGAVELTYDTFTQAAFDFFLQSQEFTSRILSLEHQNRRRGSSQMNLEALKDGQRISTDLHQLWASRPSTINLLRDHGALEHVVQPHFAQEILLHLRVYVANFFAQFIHLHRVAFETFPATAEVQTAIARIIALAKDIINSVHDGQRSETQSPSTTSSRSTANSASVTGREALAANSRHALPVMMLWPLFLAATECGTADRIWILQMLENMDKRGCPSIARMILLLKELLRRQDREGKRVDHRAVRRELFDGDLSTIY